MNPWPFFVKKKKNSFDCTQNFTYWSARVFQFSHNRADQSSSFWYPWLCFIRGPVPPLGGKESVSCARPHQYAKTCTVSVPLSSSPSGSAWSSSPPDSSATNRAHIYRANTVSLCRIQSSLMCNKSKWGLSAAECEVLLTWPDPKCLHSLHAW